MQPFYKMVEDHLRSQIHSGELGPGDLIPSEPQLAQQLGVSPGTVKKGIENLVSEKLLYRHQGKGTYVSRIDFNNSRFRFFSYGDPKGDPIRIRKETPIRKIISGTSDICSRLLVSEDTPMLYLERVGFEQETPILLEQCWWLHEKVMGLEKEEVHIPDLLYAVVVEKFGIPVIRSEETLTAKSADEEISKKLQIELKSPVVVLNRLTYTTNDIPIEFRITSGRADRFSYRTEIR